MVRTTLSILAPLAFCSAALLLGACGSDGSDDNAGPAGASSDSGDQNRFLPGAGAAIGSLHIVVGHPDLEADIVYDVGCFGDAFPVTPEVGGVDGAIGCRLLEDPAIMARLTDGPPVDQMCTEIYGGPDEAFITGEIDDQTIDATITRVNGCEIDVWETLVGLIPPAIGVTE